MEWTIAFDTLCQGPQPVNENDEPIVFSSEAAAIDEINSDPEFYEDCFPLLITEIGRKAIFTGK